MPPAVTLTELRERLAGSAAKVDNPNFSVLERMVTRILQRGPLSPSDVRSAVQAIRPEIPDRWIQEVLKRPAFSLQHGCYYLTGTPPPPHPAPMKPPTWVLPADLRGPDPVRKTNVKQYGLYIDST